MAPDDRSDVPHLRIRRRERPLVAPRRAPVVDLTDGPSTGPLVAVDGDVMTAIWLALGTTDRPVLDAARVDTGFDVALANGASAVVVSQVLPGQDGLELVRKLREHSGTAGVAVVVLGIAADPATALAAGADAHLVKGTPPDVVLDVLARLLAVPAATRSARRAAGAPADASDLAPPAPVVEQRRARRRQLA